MSAIGDCAQLAPSATIVINPLTTIAAVAALQQFLVLDPASDMPLIGTSPSNPGGLANAFTLANTLVSSSTGNAGANTPGRTLPIAELNTLADFLAQCSDSMTDLFYDCNNLASAGAPGQAFPANTLQAAIDVLHYPGSQLAELYFALPGQSPYQPILSGPPNDWTVPITLTGGDLVQPEQVVIEGSGDAVVFNCAISCVASAGAPDNIIEFSPDGSVLSAFGGLPSPAIHNVSGMAIDTKGTLWTANDGVTSSGRGNAQDSIGRLSLADPASAITYPTSAPPTTFPVAQLATPFSLVLDAAGNLYITNANSPDIEYLYNQTIFNANHSAFVGIPRGIALRPYPSPSSTGTLFVADAGADAILTFGGETSSDDGVGALTYLNAYNYGDVDGPTAVAIGANGTVWYVNSGGSSVAALDSNQNRIGDAIGSQAFGSIADLAVDGNGNVWVPSCNRSCGDQFTGNVHPDALVAIGVAPGAAGLNVLSPRFGYQPSGLARPAALAIDGSGNIWITNTGQPSVTLLVGAAAPVQTPIQAALIKNNFGQKP